MVSIVGALVKSADFDGVGKIASANSDDSTATVTFFESPERVAVRSQIIPIENLVKIKLLEETLVLCIHPLYKKWQRARCSGLESKAGHLVIFRSGESEHIPISDLYIVNVGVDGYLDPRAYLAQRCCETPFFRNFRSSFVGSYIKQRNSCRSISSLLSSGVELEAYQLAVVRRVMEDPIKRYLLADEVGLGKTIEAGMIVRELLLADSNKMIVIAVPTVLIGQWIGELTNRFYLGNLIGEKIFVVSHESLAKELVDLVLMPDVIVIDEAHHFAEKKWSEKDEFTHDYQYVATVCSRAEVCLLLSGTPLKGNETNFLSMLHLLSPDSYQLSADGIEKFKTKVEERESLGGIYQALTPLNDNSTLSELLEQIIQIIPGDESLNQLIEVASPLVDWLAGSEKDDERAKALDNVRTYLGENYRIHQRMLRNRREDEYISGLFPGLSGLEYLEWSIDETTTSVESSLEGFREQYLGSEINKTGVITPQKYNALVSKALSNPVLVAEWARELLESGGESLQGYEVAFLEDLLGNALDEQEEKDFLFCTYIIDWLEQNSEGKVVVFGGSERNVDHLLTLFDDSKKEMVERHLSGVQMAFSISSEVRVLLCDEKGEDGLNLHGGKKLIVHYDMPPSISRIEQRIGRVNRYSAGLYALPIKCVSFGPECAGYSREWIKILNEDVDIFQQSAASLQYVLEPYIEKAWNELAGKGVKSLSDMGLLFRGEDGLVKRERKKVRAQEQLNNMEVEIQAAKKYSQRVKEADENAESNSQEMQDWIIQALKFQRKGGDVESSFRYQYQPTTLMDSATFKSRCRLGLDLEASSPEEPVTHFMSFDRSKCAAGNSMQPFRYGQPFIQAIYSVLNSDTRGISAAQIREMGSVRRSEPLAFFRIEWLLCHQDKNTVIGDELYPPHIKTDWVTPVVGYDLTEWRIALLEKPYNTQDRDGYRDTNIRLSRWPALEEYYPEAEWENLVNVMYDQSYTKVSKSIEPNYMDSIKLQCLSCSVIFVV